MNEMEKKKRDEKDKIVEIVISNVLKQYEFPVDYIKYSRYKYEWFLDDLEFTDEYLEICKGLDIYFNEKERKVLFEIAKQLGYRVNRFDDYRFTKIK